MCVCVCVCVCEREGVGGGVEGCEETCDTLRAEFPIKVALYVHTCTMYG